MSFHSQQPGVTPKKDTPASKPLDKKMQEDKASDEEQDLDAEEAVDTSEWADEDKADISLAEEEDAPDAVDDVQDRKLKSAKPAKQQ